MKYKKVKNSKYKLSVKEQQACHGIIHTASVAAGACGAIPIPIADAVPMTVAQITMVISLGKVFDITVTKTIAQSILAAVAAPIVGRTAAGAALKFIPVAGWVANVGIAAGITESIGWLCVDHFFKVKYLSNDKSNSDSNFDSSLEESKFDYEKDPTLREELINRSREFLDGEKTRKNNSEDFSRLMNDLDDYRQDFPDDKEIDDSFSKLNKLSI